MASPLHAIAFSAVGASERSTAISSYSFSAAAFASSTAWADGVKVSTNAASNTAEQVIFGVIYILCLQFMEEGVVKIVVRRVGEYAEVNSVTVSTVPATPLNAGDLPLHRR